MSRQTKALHNHKALNVQNIKWEETWHYSRFKPLKNCQYFIWNAAIQCHTSNRSALNDWNTTNTQVKCTFQNRMLNNYHLDVSWKHWNYDHGQRRWVIRDFFFHLNDGKTFKILKCKMKSLLKLNASNRINLVRPLEVSNQFKLLNMQIQYHQNRFWKVKWIVNVPEKVLVIYRQFDQNFHYNIFSIPYMNIFNLEQ